MTAGWRLWKRYPRSCNILLYGVLFGCGDMSRQSLVGGSEEDVREYTGHEPYSISSEGDTKNGFDWISVRNMSLIGSVCIAPLSYAWFTSIDKHIPGSSMSAVVRKVALSQFIFGPASIITFYTAHSILESRDKTFDEVVEKGPATFITGCAFWPVAQTVNFALIPGPFRAPYVAFAQFVWSTVLSYIKTTKM